MANDSYSADLLHDNLMIEANIINVADNAGTTKLMFLESSCIYPKLAKQLMDEAALLTGPLEATNEWYAIAKIVGIELCQAYRKQHCDDVIPAVATDLYGYGDNYDLETDHVLNALVCKLVEAREAGEDEIVVWNTDSPLREFMHADDLADALVFLMQNYSDAAPINVGIGQEISISGSASTIACKVECKGRIVQDTTKPNGIPRKLMDSTRLSKLGWRSGIGLDTERDRKIAEFEGLRAGTAGQEQEEVG